MNALHASTVLGIIGGSGLYELPGLVDTCWVKVDTPWGAPSDAVFVGTLPGPAGDQRLAFLPRHGRGHRIPPGEVNYRANIAALKQLGATDVLSVSAVGSLRADLPPGHFVIVDQFIDRTVGRASSFFGTGLVAHVSMAQPVCGRLGRLVQAVLQQQGVPHTVGGTYLAMEGPQFSTLAESRLYQSWGASVIGMTNMPEAKLAREAELCYASVAMVTDFDCWHPGHEAVTVDAVVRVLLGNAQVARTLVAGLAGAVAGGLAGLHGDGMKDGPAASHADVLAAPAPGDAADAAPAALRCACRSALQHALITAPAQRDPAMVDKLRVIAGRVLQPAERA